MLLLMRSTNLYLLGPYAVVKQSFVKFKFKIYAVPSLAANCDVQSRLVGHSWAMRERRQWCVTTHNSSVNSCVQGQFLLGAPWRGRVPGPPAWLPDRPLGAAEPQGPRLCPRAPRLAAWGPPSRFPGGFIPGTLLPNPEPDSFIWVMFKWQYTMITALSHSCTVASVHSADGVWMSSRPCVCGRYRTRCETLVQFSVHWHSSCRAVSDL